MGDQPLTRMPFGFLLFKKDAGSQFKLLCINSAASNMLSVQSESVESLQKRSLISRLTSQMAEALNIRQNTFFNLEGIWTQANSSIPSLQVLQMLAVPLSSAFVAIVFQDNQATTVEKKSSKEKMDELRSIVTTVLIINDTTILTDQVVKGTFLETQHSRYFFVLQTVLSFFEGLFNIKVQQSPLMGGKETLPNPLEFNHWLSMLIRQDNLDGDNTQLFWNTYEYYSSPSDLLKKLAIRYFQATAYFAPEGIRRAEIMDMDLAARIAKFLHKWVEVRPVDFDETSVETASMILSKTWQPLYTTEPLGDLHEIWRRKLNALNPKIYSPVGGTLRSKEIQTSITKYQPEELAKQMTLLASERFRGVTPNELLEQRWSKGDISANAPHVKAIIDNFNHIQNWITSTIVMEDDVNERGSLLKQFILTAHACKSHGDFETMFIIGVALGQTSISRLKRSWKRVDDNTVAKKKWLKIESLCEANLNYKNYRTALKTRVVEEKKGATIPYLGIFLKDLTFIEESNERYADTFYVNQDRIRMVNTIINEILMCQKTLYTFDANPYLQGLLCADLQNMTEIQIYEQSKKIEPGDRKVMKTSSQNLLLPKDEEEGKIS
eukprot:TRINITY_DN7801_c0_g2_i1.p1 TRINITY_DN7801_c0_g2~~TRINITY_DN7801_c0_g2_i1.p1  ORF type:complete len:608 (-),score=155.67 TRINITY_DN7801_c0_g2_i1:364-2187(-)